MLHPADLLSGLLSRTRSLWHGLRRRRDFETDMSEEFRHHLAMRTDDLMRSGLSPEEAHRRAHIEFGHIDNHRQDARGSRGLHFFDEFGLSWLDVKLGLRMFGKYPGLSLVSVLGMSVAIAIGAGAFGWIYSLMDPRLPLPEDERIVSVQNNNAANYGNPDRRAAHDFLIWRDELKSVRELSAFTSDLRNLVTSSGVELVSVNQMTASGFRVARVTPLIGRTLLDDDERAGAPPVVVISYDVWQDRFAGDPGIVGRTIQLGSLMHTVIGVMPDGFRFPVNDQFWVPFKVAAGSYERGAGPWIQIFGRLADGVELEQARAEIATIGKRMSAQYPDTHAQLRPQVMRYANTFFDIDSPGIALAFHAGQVAISLILVLVAINVGVLVYARTATRTGEIAVRTALGASRRRVITQLFAEALVLSGTAAILGIAIASFALGKVEQQLHKIVGNEFPFWLDFGLSPGMVAYSAGLAILGAVIVGVLPALKATGANLQSGIQRLSTRGSQMQLGRTWSALIIVQVAVAVAILPFAFFFAGSSIVRGTMEPAYPIDELVIATLSMERAPVPSIGDSAAHRRAHETRFRTQALELKRRLEAEPGVRSVIFSSQFAGSGSYERVEVEGAGAAGTSSGTAVQSAGITEAVSNVVAPGFFEALDISLLAGRSFDNADARASNVLVDRVFAEQIAQSGPVLGRRIRYVTEKNDNLEAGPWFEIVGVVPTFTVPYYLEQVNRPMMYQVMSNDDLPGEIALTIRVSGTSPLAFANRLKQTAAAFDPTLQLYEPRTALDVHRERQAEPRYIAMAVTAVTLAVLLLSSAGIYAMMSFTVNKRRREIGIRAALGADPRRLLASVFARASAQLAGGVACGLVIAIGLTLAMNGGPLSGSRGILLLPAVALVMMMVGLLAAIGPARRGLAVQPTEALREE